MNLKVEIWAYRTQTSRFKIQKKACRRQLFFGFQDENCVWIWEEDVRVEHFSYESITRFGSSVLLTIYAILAQKLARLIF